MDEARVTTTAAERSLSPQSGPCEIRADTSQDNELRGQQHSPSLPLPPGSEDTAPANCDTRIGINCDRAIVGEAGDSVPLTESQSSRPDVDSNSQAAELGWFGGPLDSWDSGSRLGRSHEHEAEIESPAGPRRPNTLDTDECGTAPRVTGSSSPDRSPERGSSSSATASGSPERIAAPAKSWPTSPSQPPRPQHSYDPGNDFELPPEYYDFLEDVPEEFKALVADQLIKKDRLIKALDAEKSKLETLIKEIDIHIQVAEKNISSAEIKNQAESETSELRSECDNSIEEIDPGSIHRVSLEDSSEFYEDNYTAEDCASQSLNVEPSSSFTEQFIGESDSSRNYHEESDGPP